MKIIKLLAVILCLLFSLNDQANARSIIFNKTTGFAQTLPFDEYFEIKLEGFSSDSFKLMHMVFKELGRKEPEVKDSTDSIYFASLPVLMNISFDENGTGIAYMKLEPSKYYFVELTRNVKEPLATPERKALSDSLKKDESIKTAYLDSLTKGAFNATNVNAIYNILQIKIKQINTNYIVGKMNRTANDSVMYAAVKKIKSSSAGLGQNMENVLVYVRSKEQLKGYASELDSLFNSINFGNEEVPVYLPSVKGSFEDYKKSLDDLFVRLTTSLPEQKEVLNNARDDLKTRLETMKAREDALIGLVNNAIDITTEHTYVIRGLVFTKPDETVVEGTANRLNASISQTFGWGLSPKTSSGFLYVGYSLFPRAVNSSVPFRNIPARDRWKVMLGLNVGFTLTDMTTNNYGKASGIVSFLGDKALLTGICFRPYHFIKLDLNGLLYAMNDPDPLINHKRLAFAPLIGISLSLNVVKLFSGQPNSFTTLSEQFKK